MNGPFDMAHYNTTAKRMDSGTKVSEAMTGIMGTDSSRSPRTTMMTQSQQQGITLSDGATVAI